MLIDSLVMLYDNNHITYFTAGQKTFSSRAASRLVSTMLQRSARKGFIEHEPVLALSLMVKDNLLCFCYNDQFQNVQ